jgi:tetratricopeptide (TPR) repeat protein
MRAGVPFCPSCGAGVTAGTAAHPAVSSQQPKSVPSLAAQSKSARQPGSPTPVPKVQVPGGNRNTFIIIGVVALVVILAAVFVLLPMQTTPSDSPISVNPDAKKAIGNAWALNAKGKFPDAVTAADTAISKDPAVADGYAMKGWALAGLGRHTEALVALDKALSLDSNNAITWSNKGFALMNLGRCPEAVTAFDRALSLDPYDYGSKKYRIMAADHCPVKP